MRRIWKRFPIKFRNSCHFVLHKVNTSQVLLSIFQFRQIFIRRKIQASNKEVWLRVGESRLFPYWLSTNYQVFTKNFLDVTKVFGTQNCKYIYADNVIEHLNKGDAQKFLSNCFEALVSGGSIRVATPNLSSIAVRYIIGSRNDVEQMDLDLKQHNLDITEPSDLLRVTFTAWGHHKGVIYDFDYLKKLLEKSGFGNIKQYKPGDSENSDLRNLESRTCPSDLWSQMAVEATKP